MKNYTNGYFRMMKDIGEGFERIRAQRKAEKEELIKNEDWDALEKWYEREKSFPAPFSQGYIKAYRAWMESTEYNSDVFEVRDLPWEKDAHDFIICLKEARVSEFAITDRSTALMDLLHAFEKEGCTMKGLCEVKHTDERWGEKEIRNGILMSL